MVSFLGLLRSELVIRIIKLWATPTKVIWKDQDPSGCQESISEESSLQIPNPNKGTLEEEDQFSKPTKLVALYSPSNDMTDIVEPRERRDIIGIRGIQPR